MHFFRPNLRCKIIEPMAKSCSLVVFPAQKKEPKWFQNPGRFKKNSSAQRPKNLWLCLNMANGNHFSKWQTPLRNAKCSFQGANQRRGAQFSCAATVCQKDDWIETSTVPQSTRSAKPWYHIVILGGNRLIFSRKINLIGPNLERDIEGEGTLRGRF